MEFLDTEFLGNTARSWLISAGLFLGSLAGIRMLGVMFAGHVAKLAERTGTWLDDSLAAALAATRPFLLTLIVLFFASRPLEMSDRVAVWLLRLATAALLIQIGFWTVAWLNVVLGSWKERRWGDDPGAASSFRFVGYALEVAVWAIVVLLLLENLGVDISALVAGLGIGGIAVALAVQNILGDLFASLTILLDKPFVVGDSLRVDDLSGTVQSIGLNTTRVTSLSGEQLVFSNKDLLQSRIRNFGRMEERRIAFHIGVVYGTPSEQVEKIPGMIESAICNQPMTRFERSHFKEFGDSALVFETVYFMTVPDYASFMDVQQAVNLQLLRSFSEQGISFAYPTQHVYLESASPATRGSVDVLRPGG